MRQLAAAREFANDGYETAVYGFSPEYDPNCEFTLRSDEFGLSTRCDAIECAVNGADIIVLPLPYSCDGIHLNCKFYRDIPTIDTLFRLLGSENNAIVFGGMFNETAFETAKINGIILHDYYKFEEVCIKNAVLTAEGALEIALREIKTTLQNSKVLILGYGRIGKYLAHILKALGADVSVSARKEQDLAWISSLGYHPLKTELISQPGDCNTYNFDIVFNTIPAVIIDRNSICKFPPQTVYIELASAPGGICLKSAEEYRLKVIQAPSLPGKCAPYTAGKIIKEAIENFMYNKSSPCF